MRDRERHEKRVGTVVDGRWRVDALLGWGSTSAVYSATHRNGHRAALKILHKSLCSDETVLRKFSSEAGIANSIRHRSIVPVHDDGVTEDGCAYLVLDLLEGETLEEIRARKSGRIPLEDLAPMAEELMSALAAVHAAGIVHRDLKPQNIFRTTKGELKLLDFGSARIFDAAPAAVSAAGLVRGTPAFMSPEQAKGARAEIDAQSDVWSLGATLFTLLSGEYVHLGRDAQARLLAAASQPARKLWDVAPSVDDRVATVIDRALFQDKSERWPDVQTMRIAFRNAVLTAVPTMRDLAVYASSMAPPPLDEEPVVSSAAAVALSEPRELAGPLSQRPSERGGIATPMALTSRIPPRASLRPLDRESDFDLGVASTRGDLAALQKKGIPPIALLTGAAAMAAVVLLVVFFKAGGDASTGHAGAALPEAPPSETAAPAPESSGPGFMVIEAPDDPAAAAAALRKVPPVSATAPLPVARKEKEPAASVVGAATSPAAAPAAEVATSATSTTTRTAATDAGAAPAPPAIAEPPPAEPAPTAAAHASTPSEAPAPAETDAK